MVRHLKRRHIVIIGGGFAGTVTAIKLLDGAQGAFDISVVEARAELGRGLAYSTGERVHLVNGPARNFGLHPEDPLHLARWLKANAASLGWSAPEDAANSTPPRWIYGSYVQSELERAINQSPAKLLHVRDRAVALEQKAGGWRVTLANGEPLAAEDVVLALGVFPLPLGGPEAVVADHPRFVRSTWDSAALDRAASAESVLILGQSLSMVDAVASLNARGYRGPITAVSRRGHLIEARRETPEPVDFLAGSPLPRTARALIGRVKAERRRYAREGLDWQALPFALRAHNRALWSGADIAERRRFARHARSLWDVALHRAAAASHLAVDRARAEGRFAAIAARLLSVTPEASGFSVTLKPRGGAPVSRHFGAIIDCRGHQNHDWTRIDDPLVRQLVDSGLTAPHPTGFGLTATPDGLVTDREGTPRAGLHAIGHPLRGVAWESSSIGEQLAQAIALAGRLLASAHAVPAAASSMERLEA